MAQEEIVISLAVPRGLLAQLDLIGEQKCLSRTDILIDALAFYSQFHDMNSEQFPETMRSVFFNLARHDDEFRALLRQVVKDNPVADVNNQ